MEQANKSKRSKARNESQTARPRSSDPQRIHDSDSVSELTKLVSLLRGFMRDERGSVLVQWDRPDGTRVRIDWPGWPVASTVIAVAAMIICGPAVITAVIPAITRAVVTPAVLKMVATLIMKVK